MDMCNGSGNTSKKSPQCQMHEVSQIASRWKLKPHVGLEWNDLRKTVVAKEAQVGLSWHSLSLGAGLAICRKHQTGLADVIEVPKEVFDLKDLKDVLSMETWKECLSDSERSYLSEFLPQNVDPELSANFVLGGDNVSFGNPLSSWGQLVCNRNAHPDTVASNELKVQENRRHYHNELQSYHKKLIESLQELKAIWNVCKNPRELQSMFQKWMKGRSGLELDGLKENVGSKRLLKCPIGKGFSREEKQVLRGVCEDFSSSQKKRKRVAVTPLVETPGEDLSQKDAVSGDELPDYVQTIKIGRKQHMDLVRRESGTGELNMDILNSILSNSEDVKLRNRWTLVVRSDIPKAVVRFKEFSLNRTKHASSVAANCMHHVYESRKGSASHDSLEMRKNSHLQASSSGIDKSLKQSSPTCRQGNNSFQKDGQSYNKFSGLEDQVPAGLQAANSPFVGYADGVLEKTTQRSNVAATIVDPLRQLDKSMSWHDGHAVFIPNNGTMLEDIPMVSRRGHGMMFEEDVALVSNMANPCSDMTRFSGLKSDVFAPMNRLVAGHTRDVSQGMLHLDAGSHTQIFANGLHQSREALPFFGHRTENPNVQRHALKAQFVEDSGHSRSTVLSAAYKVEQMPFLQDDRRTTQQPRPMLDVHLGGRAQRNSIFGQRSVDNGEQCIAAGPEKKELELFKDLPSLRRQENIVSQRQGPGKLPSFYSNEGNEQSVQSHLNSMPLLDAPAPLISPLGQAHQSMCFPSWDNVGMGGNILDASLQRQHEDQWFDPRFSRRFNMDGSELSNSLGNGQNYSVQNWSSRHEQNMSLTGSHNPLLDGRQQPFVPISYATGKHYAGAEQAFFHGSWNQQGP